MNLSTMDYFLAVARTRSITRAAQELHITQQSLSAHIAGLERELGSPLFLRKVPLELTYAGEVFLRYAQSFREGYTALRREFSDLADDQQGRLRVGISYFRGRLLMPEIIRRFQARYPRIEVCLYESYNEGLNRWTQEGAVDLAVAAFPDTVPGLEVEDFYHTEILLVIPRALLAGRLGAEWPAAAAALERGELSALNGFPLIMGSPGDVNGRVGEALLRQHHLRPERKAQTESVQTMMQLCLRGVGGCFYPRDGLGLLTGEERAGLLCFPLGEEARFAVRFGYLRRARQWSVLTHFLQIARETAAERDKNYMSNENILRR